MFELFIQTEKSYDEIGFKMSNKLLYFRYANHEMNHAYNDNNELYYSLECLLCRKAHCSTLVFYLLLLFIDHFHNTHCFKVALQKIILMFIKSSCLIVI